MSISISCSHNSMSTFGEECDGKTGNEDLDELHRIEF